MYKEGIQLGDNSYILSDEDGELTIINGTCTSQEMEEYLQISNQYDEKLEEKFYLTDRISEINNNDKKAKITNIVMFITTIGFEGLTLTLSLMSSAFPTALFVLAPTIPIICFGAGMISNIVSFGTKKKRKQEREKLNGKNLEIKKELEEIKNKIDTIKNQIQYSETRMYEDKIIPVTTVENKKANVKMRVLRLDQSR